MFLDCLKEDKYFRNLFPEISSHEKFELHCFEFDITNDCIRLFLQTELMPVLRNKKDEGKDIDHSSVEIAFHSIENLVFKKEFKRVQNMTFSCQENRVEAFFGGDLLLSFQFDMAKLEKWDLFKR